MRARGIVCCLGVAGVMAAAGSAAAAPWRDGAQVYEKVCRHCHEANVGPALKGRALPAQYVAYVVRHGNRAMPAFRPSEIDDAALADLARVVSAGAPLAKE